MRCSVVLARATVRPFATRLPFRFGAVTITRLERLVLEIHLRDDQGRGATGFAADFLVPRWFDKRPGITAEQDVLALQQSVRMAVEGLLQQSAEPQTVFARWHALEERTFAGLRTDPDAALVAGFGLALVERALMDAACRAARISFHDALHCDLFGFRPELVLPELSNWKLESVLPARPAHQVRLRHTVGFLDALRRSEIATDPADGLPACLEDDIRDHGLTAFKVKLSGEAGRDGARLLRVSEVLGDNVPRSALRVTLDANEQYSDLSALAAMLDGVAVNDCGRRFLAALAFIEQPIPRRDCCSAATAAGIAQLARHAPVLLDEGDSDTTAFARARSAGWRGVSVKTCKGVFRALLNYGLVERSNGKLLLSAEDLTCPPTTALQQDLALVASLHLPDVEKNAHHYFRGLDALDPEERDGALRCHPQLYERTGALVHLAVHGGMLALRDLDSIGYGAGADPRSAADTELFYREP